MCFSTTEKSVGTEKMGQKNAMDMETIVRSWPTMADGRMSLQLQGRPTDRARGNT